MLELLQKKIQSANTFSDYYFFAKTHNLVPILLNEIKHKHFILPQPIESLFRKDYLFFLSKDYQRNKQLVKIVQVLDNYLLPHILLKGSHLAEKVYEKSNLRIMSDIDILIRKEDFAKCQIELSKIGYECAPHEMKAFELLPFKDKHFPVLTRAGNFPIEFHWNIHRNYDYKYIDKLWERACSFTIDGIQTKGLSTEDLLIHICVHKALDDNFISSLVLLSDIREILSKYKIDWNKLYVIITSEWINSAKALFTALYMYNTLMGGNIPQDFLDKIRPSDFDKKMEELITKQMFSTDITDLSTRNTYISIDKLKGKPAALFKYLMSPKRICLRYEKEFSLWILPLLYARRIKEKVSEAFKLLFMSLRKNDSFYAILKNTAKIRTWLRN